MLHTLFGNNLENCVADIIFVHGLNPLGKSPKDHCFHTWGGTDHNSDFWPRWLGEDLAAKNVSVVIRVLEYDAAALGWLGHSMPLADRAANVLDTFYGEGIGDRPIVFVAHSLGGLVVKQLLFRSAAIAKETERHVAQKTRAVVFLATPHTGASLASFINSLGPLLKQTAALKDLAANTAPLREQAEWYIDKSSKLGIKTRTYIETKPMSPIGIIVDASSANPNVAGASVVPVDCNHSEISKIASRDVSHYKSLFRFIEEALRDASVSEMAPNPR